MRKVLLVATPSIGGSQGGSGLIPIRTTLSVEARHKKDATTLTLRQNDVAAFEHKGRLLVTDLVSFAGGNAGLDGDEGVRLCVNKMRDDSPVALQRRK